MAELRPAEFGHLVTRIMLEAQAQGTIFDLPRRVWFVPAGDAPDFSVAFHGRRAGTPVGPAAGPHTQMAQNIALAYLAGARIMELKTVQINDRLEIPRPCIDMTNVGYNVEWSQELRLEESAREYVAGMMLTRILRGVHPELRQALAGDAGEVIFDLSVGYDLAGIRSAPMQRFLDTMRDASALIETLRAQIPPRFAAARALDFPACISGSVTLSTFHGCPAGEIERIAEFLLCERGLSVVLKMNPPMLGRERLEYLLHELMGYTEIQVPEHAYTSGLQFGEAVAMCARLAPLAAAHGLHVGFKFSNTLEVRNHRSFFGSENELMYLSGPPLHVITMELTDQFRRVVGPAVPISFSAGIDRHNFPLAVAAGLLPVTISTDLLKTGGYGRLEGYFKSLAEAMAQAGAHTIDEYILAAHGGPLESVRKETARWGLDPADPAALAAAAGLLNTARAAQQARQDERYRAPRQRATPPRTAAALETFDCLTCNKCLPVCPNDANFTYPSPPQGLAGMVFQDLVVGLEGDAHPAGEPQRLALTRPMQIANWADFCNECGNCDTFCPQVGGPYLAKPTFFSRREDWAAAAPAEGVWIDPAAQGQTAQGRMDGVEYRLSLEPGGAVTAEDPWVSLRLEGPQLAPVAVTLKAPLSAPHRVNMRAIHTLRLLLLGAANPTRLTPVTAAWAGE